MNATKILNFFKAQFTVGEEKESDIKIRPWIFVNCLLIIAAPAVLREIWIRMNQSGAEINFSFIVLFIIQMIMFYYLPATLIYGISRVLDTGYIEPTIRSPFLGFSRLSEKNGFIVWTIQMILAGGVLSSFIQLFRNGINPIIPF